MYKIMKLTNMKLNTACIKHNDIDETPKSLKQRKRPEPIIACKFLIKEGTENTHKMQVNVEN